MQTLRLDLNRNNRTIYFTKSSYFKEKLGAALSFNKITLKRKTTWSVKYAPDAKSFVFLYRDKCYDNIFLASSVCFH